MASIFGPHGRMSEPAELHCKSPENERPMRGTIGACGRAAIWKTRKDVIVPSEPLDLIGLIERLKRDERLLGLDVGTKTIGLALSDVMRQIATPLETIKRTKFKQDAARLLELAARHGAGGFVIGLPVNLDGTEGPRAQSTRAFARNLAPLTELPLAFWDERLSTAAAERALLEADASRKRRAELIDKMAAAYILQGALDRYNFGRRDA
jgi:putative Holliday junction resolvase